MEQETVPVTVAEKEVFGYTAKRDHTLFGKVTSRIYEGEAVQRHFYTPEGTTQEYRLGPTSSSFEFVDHVQALDPLLERGYQLHSLNMMKGGLKMFAMLSPKNPRTIDDPIIWDSPVWGQKNQSLFEAIIVSSSIGPGHGIHYSIGWFRVICTNGLISEILGTGRQKYSHLNWSRESLTGFLDSNHLDGEVSFPIGTKAGLAKAKDLLVDLQSDGTYKTIPLPIRKTVEPLLRIPGWYQSAIDEQFNMILENSPTDEVSTLDLLNVITSPISLEREAGNNRDRFLSRTDRIALPLCQLIAFLSLVH